MIDGKTIFIISLMKYDGLPSTNFTIANYLAKSNKVFYIDHPFTIKDYLQKNGSDSYLKRKPKFSPFSDGIISTENPNLKIVISPPVLPINWLPEGKLYRFLLGINESIVLSRIRKVIKANNVKDYIFINFFEFHYPTIGHKLSASLNAYYCVDPIVVPYDQKHGLTSERQIIEFSDLVICTSKALYEEKRRINPNTYLIPNAADTVHHMTALDNDLKLHPSLKDIPKPIVGFVGYTERRMDFNLLKEVILAQSDKSFVFAGPIAAEYTPDWFYELKNIYCLGNIPYSELPQLLKGYDLCIIPFKKDEVSSTIFPLKLFEYLGAGKSVVSTNFNPDLKYYTEDSVVYCEDAECFSKSLNELLQVSSSKTQYNLSIAQKNTWEIRVQELLALISRFLNKK